MTYGMAMRNWLLLFVCTGAMPGGLPRATAELPVVAAELPVVVAKPLRVDLLAASSQTPSTPYLAFPTALDLGDELLVAFKRGRSHAGDVGATIHSLRLDKRSGRQLAEMTLAEIPTEIMQMGEWVRFPAGDIANYVDAQKTGSLRSGLCEVRSTDGGKNFAEVRRVGPIDGVEYGYAFDAVSNSTTTWMLAMTFANLPGGKPVYKYASQPGSVDVIRSDDNGRSWRFVTSVTRLLGDVPINESSIVRSGDGFIIASRGYDGRSWLLRVDADFRRVAQADLTASNPRLKSVDRPRLFSRDGNFYLLGRNRLGRRESELAMFRFNPQTLEVTRHVVLDHASDRSPGDSFYAQPYWLSRECQTLFHVITYKQTTGPGPDIIRLEFAWDQLNH
jgi:hypothetical protein